MIRSTYSCGRQTRNALWRYRKRMGFSQEQVAAVLGYVSADQIANWERGRRFPSLLAALKLEIIYRVPVAFLFPELYDRLRADLRSREDLLRPTWRIRRGRVALEDCREPRRFGSQ